MEDRAGAANTSTKHSSPQHGNTAVVDYVRSSVPAIFRSRASERAAHADLLLRPTRQHQLPAVTDNESETTMEVCET